MEKIAKYPVLDSLKNFLLLTKPGIIAGNALTAVGGFTLASRGFFDVSLFIGMLEGLFLIIAAASVFNNIIDKELDKKMVRTKNRPLPREVISPKAALIFAFLLGIMGVMVLSLFTNPLTLTVSLIGLVVYVLVYSFLKYKTSYGTLIGSIAGATPPVIGYIAVSGRIDLGAIVLFIMIALWQMPHFYAIAIFRLEDYAKGKIPILPLRKSVLTTKVHMIFYCLAFLLTANFLAFFDYTGPLYLALMSLSGFAWLILAIQGLTCKNDQRWARKMFFFSLFVIMTFCAFISILPLW